MEYLSIGYDQLKQELGMELNKAANSFVRIGYLLKMAKDTQVLEGKYENVWEFAKGEFGLDKSQASRFMNMNDRFSEGGNSDRLLPQFEGYGSSKLAIMLTLPGEVVEELSPAMSKSEIAEVAKLHKEEMQDTPLTQMMEPVEDRIRKMNPLQKAIYVIGKENPDLWKECSAALGGETMDDVIRDTKDAMAPDEEKMYRIKIPGEGRKIVKVAGNWVTITDMRSGEKNSYTIEDAANAWGFLGADPTDIPEDTWEECYGEDFPGKPKVAPVQQAPEPVNTRSEGENSGEQTEGVSGYKEDTAPDRRSEDRSPSPAGDEEQIRGERPQDSAEHHGETDRREEAGTEGPEEVAEEPEEEMGAEETPVDEAETPEEKVAYRKPEVIPGPPAGHAAAMNPPEEIEHVEAEVVMKKTEMFFLLEKLRGVISTQHWDIAEREAENLLAGIRSRKGVEDVSE